MEKTVTGLIISAAGGVYFTDEENDNPVEMALPDPLADLSAQSVQYAARGFIAYTNVADGSIKGSAPITKTKGKPVGCMALGTDNISGLRYLLVQYNLLVDNRTLVYQLFIGDNGRVEYRIGQQDNTTGDNAYTFRIDLKRDTETLSFGGGNAYAINPINKNNEKSWWFINSTQSLQNRRLSIYPKSGTINGTPNYTSIDASVVLSDKSKEALANASSLLIFVTPQYEGVTPAFENKAYKTGDNVRNPQNEGNPYRVVYNGKPADMDNFTFAVYDLSPNKRYYLYAYLCKADGSQYAYAADALVTSDGLRTRPMETPANVTVGEPQGNVIPLTFTATPFKTLIMKSDSVQSCNPQGVLQAGDRDGNVIAILDKGVTTYDVEMEPGEMTYLQMFAMTDETVPGYSSNFSLVPLYRRADRLPLGYTFGDKDNIPQSDEDAASPILPPGLSSDLTGWDNAFFVTYPSNLDHTFYLASQKVEKTPAWPSVILPAFSGAQNIQATFQTKFYKSGQLGLSAGAPESTDSVRIEYRLNGGAWRTAGLFTTANMPEAIAYVYPLSVSFSCRATDVVELRYSYYANYSDHAMNAIASYEFVAAGECEMPSGLKVLNEKTTDKAVALTWNDNNTPATGNYIVSYQKYVAPASDDEADDVLALAETDDEDDEAWETKTVNATQATLRNLENTATYNIRVQAVCTFGTSLASTQVQVTVPAGLPYVENMVFDEYDRATAGYAVKPNVSVYKGEPGIEEAADYLEQALGETPASWNALQCEAAAIFTEEPDALAVSTAQDEALLATPAIFIHKYVTPLPKTLTFRVNTYAFNEDYEPVNGVDLLDPDLRLYVLVSTDGAFSWNDTVAAYDHNALKATAAAGDGDLANRGMDLTLPMDKYEGLIRIAFYFHNPNTFDYYDPANEDKTPMFLELLGISLNYDGDVPCFPIEALKASGIDETVATLTWEGEGEEYGITYYPAADKAQAKTVYQEATDADWQTLTLQGLTSNTDYVAEVVSYCTKGEHANGSIPVSVEFTTLRALFAIKVDITPEEGGTVKGAGSYFEGGNVTLTATPNAGYRFVAWKDGDTELSKDATYKFQMPGKNITYTAVFAEAEMFSVTVNVTPTGAGTVKGADDYFEGNDVTLTATPNVGYKFIAWKNGETELGTETTYHFQMPGENVTYTAVFEQVTANEDPVLSHFNVSTDNGRIIVRNLNGLTVKDVDIYSLTGLRINRFTPNSREDLILPVDAAHALIFVRLNTEKGVAVYKVYLH
ncbi:MAG: hypothetical protein K2L03_02110 [Bacteroidales bacterium]|nr:hypothetical protein [Bacteroidales bacterium]